MIGVYARGRAASFLIGDHSRPAPFHDRNDTLYRSEVNADDFFAGDNHSGPVLQ